MCVCVKYNHRHYIVVVMLSLHLLHLRAVQTTTDQTPDTVSEMDSLYINICIRCIRLSYMYICIYYGDKDGGSVYILYTVVYTIRYTF